MDLRVLKSLVCVVEEGSIAAAAQREGITASAISQRLQALEAELQVKLLVRSGRSVQPTTACIALLPQIRRVLKEGNNLALSLSRTTNAGRFRLGAVSTALTDYVPRIVHQTAQSMPDMELGIHPGTSAQLYRAFQDGDLDAVLCVEPPFNLPKSQHFETRVRHPIGLIRAISPVDHDLPFIVYSRTAWGGAACWRAVERHDKSPPILCELDALETIAILVQSGLGVAMVPEWEGLKTRFSSLKFQRIGGDHRALGILFRTHEVDHPMVEIIRSGFGVA